MEIGSGFDSVYSKRLGAAIAEHRLSRRGPLWLVCGVDPGGMGIDAGVAGGAACETGRQRDCVFSGGSAVFATFGADGMLYGDGSFSAVAVGQSFGCEEVDNWPAKRTEYHWYGRVGMG